MQSSFQHLSSSNDNISNDMLSMIGLVKRIPNIALVEGNMGL